RGSSRIVEGVAIQADLTVTFAQPKIPHVFAPAAEFCGMVVVADISIPDAAVEDEDCRLDLITAIEVAPLCESRRPETHKGTYGHVALVAGSEGRTGAAIMAARSAVRGGAGLVSVVTDRASADIIDSVSIESMSKAVEMSESTLDWILEFISDKDAVLVGPGLADDEDSYELIRALIGKTELPTVIDASGLNAFEGRIEDLRSDAIRIITPHPGELGRLVGSSSSEINENRIEAARDAASRSGAFVVLKGHQTLVASPDGRVSVNPTGNAGMASGGMGDVLAGLLVAILARGDDPFESARAAVFLHGLAADILRDESSDIGLRAMDVAEELPRAVAAVREMAG
ncbi:MAG: NAD(P)H-hydrate dehydratase, partial [Thermoanaerobaculia bacterium]|nr:NAD(P)H-hydrate dehydratase [Thermoanaerobaculia bacterium]